MATLFENFELGMAALEDKVGITKDKAARLYAEQTADDAVAAGTLDAGQAADAQKQLTAEATTAEETQGIVDKGLDKLGDQLKQPLLGILNFGKWTIWIAVIAAVAIAAFLYAPRKKAAP